MKMQAQTPWLVAMAVSVGLFAGAAQAALVSYSASAPTTDIAIFSDPVPGPNGNNTFRTRWKSGDTNKNESVGQSFTVGASDVAVASITVLQKAMNSSLDDNEFFINIYELANTSTAPTSLTDRVLSETIAAGQFSSAKADEYATISLGSSVTLDANTVYAFTIGVNTANDDDEQLDFYNGRSKTDFTGGFSVLIENNDGATSGIDLLPSNSTATWDFNTGNDSERDLIFYVQQVPEPASLALLGLGGLMMLRRRR